MTASDDAREEAEAQAVEDRSVSKGYLRSGFERVRPFLEACQRRWQESFNPFWLLVIDETMVQWEGASQAHVTSIPRKPTPLGYLLRTLVCG